jgi:anti-sigma factor RsiW
MSDRPDQHPSTEQLSAFNLGRLDDEASPVIEAHLLGCADCCARLAGLSAQSDALLSGLRALPGNQGGQPTLDTS